GVAERRGVDFFPYKPPHLAVSAPRAALARIANMVQEILVSDKYDGAIWTEGSPRIEETIYWLNLLVDTTVPICGDAAQRMHGMISNDGPKKHPRLGRLHRLAGLGRRTRTQPGRCCADPGAAGLRRPRRAEGRRPSRGLFGDGRTRRHPRCSRSRR